MRLFIFVVISVFAYSCNKAVLRTATVDVTKPPTIYGNNRALEAGDHNSISLEYTKSNNNITAPIYGYIQTEGEQGFSADYHLIEDTWGLQFNVVNKGKNDLYAGAGIGAQGFPYAFLNAGLNKKSFELGSAILFGFRSSKIYYEGDYEDEDGKIIGSFCRKKYLWSAGAYLYTSIYFERFALNYVASYTMQDKTFSHYYDGSGFLGSSVDVYLKTPNLYIQDIGVVYVNNHIKYRIGLSQTGSYDFPRRYYGTSFQAAWLW